MTFDFQLLEKVAFVLSILFVFLNANAKIISWLFGILASLLYTLIFYEAGIYGDAVLQIFYVLMGVYGWWAWTKSRITTVQIDVKKIAKVEILILSVIAIVTIPVAGFILSRFTDSDIPYWDATTTVVSLLATWAMAKQYIENWIIWIVIDAICIGVYLYKGLDYTALLFAIYTLMAVYGYYKWRGLHDSEQ